MILFSINVEERQVIIHLKISILGFNSLCFRISDESSILKLNETPQSLCIWNIDFTGTENLEKSGKWVAELG